MAYGELKLGPIYRLRDCFYAITEEKLCKFYNNRTNEDKCNSCPYFSNHKHLIDFGKGK